MPARKKIVVLMAAWNQLCPPPAIDPAITDKAQRRAARLDVEAERRHIRLRYCARLVGHFVDSTDQLTDAELETVIQQIQAELRAQGIAPRSSSNRTRGRFHSAEGRSADPTAGKDASQRHGNLRRMPNRGVATEKMVWKIRQLEAHLGWAGEPTRLSGFLRQFFKKSQPEQLTHGQAWRAIESLFAIAARAAIKAARGAAYQVPAPELAAEVARLKVVLQSWQPEEVPHSIARERKANAIARPQLAVTNNGTS